MAWAGIIRLAMTMLVAASASYGGFQLADQMCQNKQNKREIEQYEFIHQEEEMLRQTKPRNHDELFERLLHNGK